MVDVTPKPEVYREATARGSIKLKPETIKRIEERRVEKGDPIEIAKVAGILAAKNTSNMVPLCHPLPLTSVRVDLKTTSESRVEATATVKTKAQTGVEMEALVAVSVALLTVWDMVKQYEKDEQGQYPHTAIEEIRVVEKVKKE